MQSRFMYVKCFYPQSVKVKVNVCMLSPSKSECLHVGLLLCESEFLFSMLMVSTLQFTLHLEFRESRS